MEVYIAAVAMWVLFLYARTINREIKFERVDQIWQGIWLIGDKWIGVDYVANQTKV